MKDNFSSQSASYGKYRPDYPPELYDCIFRHVNNFDHAWDCATGNGQAAKQLATVFNRVEATDISFRQLENAHQASNIHYQTCPAESTTFNDNQFDLVTVAQALHWFDFDRCFKEVKRVLKPSGVLAVWTYGLLTISPEIDALITDFYRNTIGPYWDGERKHVDNQYQEIDFPFQHVLKNSLFIYKNWSLSTLAGYIQTWSSVEKYRKISGKNPVTNLQSRLSQVWTESKSRITFPITLYILTGH